MLHFIGWTIATLWLLSLLYSIYCAYTAPYDFELWDDEDFLPDELKEAA